MRLFILNLFNRILAFFKDMAVNLLIIYEEKGAEPFKKPLLLAVPPLYLLYLLVASPMSAKLKIADSEFKSMSAVAQHAEEYKEAKAHLESLQRKLPLLKDKDDWLNYVITNSARAYGISFDSLSAQNEQEIQNYLVASRGVSVTTTYDMLGKWLADIENSPIFLRVVDLTIRRDDSSPGGVRVSFTLSTVFSKPEKGAS